MSLAINRASLSKGEFIAGFVGRTVNFRLIKPLVNKILKVVIPYVNKNYLAGKSFPLTF